MAIRSNRIARQSLWRIFATPAALFVMTVAGLFAGLTGDGWPDGIAALCLALPIVIFSHHWLRKIDSASRKYPT